MKEEATDQNEVIVRVGLRLNNICQCHSRVQLKKSRLQLDPFLRWDSGSN